MESGNSASIQSSSPGGGGAGAEDQELDSQTTNISAFLNNHLPPITLTPLTYPPQSQALFQLHYSFNHDDAYYHHTNNNNYKFDPPTFSESTMINNHDYNNINHSKDHTSVGVVVWPNNNPNNQELQSQPLQAPLALPSGADTPGSGKRDHQGISGGVGSNPTKKRSRASRRTPTTVLATDTNNFRQMVQDFTGIPASPFESPRLDFFGGVQFPRARETSMLDVSSSTMAMQPPPYLMSPFPHNNNNNNQHQTKVTTFLPRPAAEECQVGMSLIGPKPTNSALLTEFALGHNIINTTAATRTSISISDTMVGGTAGNVNTGITGVGNHAGRGGAGVITRGGETVVDSWICSSDD